MKRIYEHFDTILQKVFNNSDVEYNINWQRYDDFEPHNIGIILLESRDDEACLSGEVMYECLKVEVHVTCIKDDIEDINNSGHYLRDSVKQAESLETVTDGLDVVNIYHLGSVVRPSYDTENTSIIKTCFEIEYLFSS